MKAEIKPRINLEGRTRLETVIPLSTPYLVFLDPSSLCNAHCKHCPTGTEENKKYYTPGLMDLNLFKKIVDDLCQMSESVKTLRLYSDGEPLLNPQLSDMIHYAKNTERFGQIDFTTNGLLLTPWTVLELVRAGLDKIFISVPTRYSKAYVTNIRFLYDHGRGTTEIYVKTIGDMLTIKQKAQFIADFGNISDRIFIERLAPCWSGYKVKGVNAKRGIYNQPLPEKDPKVCAYIFYSLKINSDGTVSLCFLDWKRDLYLGNLRQQSFSKIWNSDLLRDYRIAHLTGERKSIDSCGKCQQLRYGAADNIDKYAEEILKRIGGAYVDQQKEMGAN